MAMELERWLLLLPYDLHCRRRRSRRHRCNGAGWQGQGRNTAKHRGLGANATDGASDGVPSLLLVWMWVLRITAAAGTLFSAGFAQCHACVVWMLLRVCVLLLLLLLRELLLRRQLV